MTSHVVLISLGYTTLGVLLLWLSLESRIAWWIKAAAIVVTSGFFVVVFFLFFFQFFAFLFLFVVVRFLFLFEFFDLGVSRFTRAFRAAGSERCQAAHA